MKPSPELEAAYYSALMILAERYDFLATEIATEFHLSYREATLHLAAEMSRHLGSTPQGAMDSRTAKWRCRFTIYNVNYMDEAQADSDADLPLGQPGSTVIAGLPNVAAEAAELARHFHSGLKLHSLGTEDLAKGLRGLRPTLSRGRGKGTWRINYETTDALDRFTKWLMRVDIIREDVT